MKMNDNEKFTLKFDPKRLLLNPGFFTVSPVAKYRITIESDGDTTTAKMLVNGKEVKTATAKRNPADKANWRIGAQTAFDRLWKKREKTEKERSFCGFKVGDRVVCIDDKDYIKRLIGKHGRVVSVDDDALPIGVEFDEDIYGHSCDERAKGGHGWYFKTNELCHEQPTKQKVREVKRHAKVGEWVKIVNKGGWKSECYKQGEILRVVQEKSSISVFLSCGGCSALDNEYVVLEGYQPGRDA